MSFLNAILLLGGLAFVVPLIIHLLNRSKFQTVEWGAMHLLDNIELQNSKRIQWQAILLLLLRCAAPIVLALCMARPLWNMWSGGRVGDAATTILMVDDSYSMQADSGVVGTEGDDAKATLFSQATAAAQAIATGVGGKSAKAVVTLSDTPQNLTEGTSYDSKPVFRQLDRMEASHGPVSPIEALQVAIDTLNKSPEPYRQIALWSDFQRHDWDAIPEESLKTIRDELKRMPVPGQLHLFPVKSASGNNLYVTIDSNVSELTLVGEPIEIRATINNIGETAAGDVNVRLLLDDKEISAKKMEVASKGQVQVSFVVAVEQPGTHYAKLVINDTGTIHADDEDQLRIDALKPLNVLLVEDDTNRPLLESETGFLQLALQSTFREDGKSVGLALDRQATSRLTVAMLEKCDVIVLANVARIKDELIKPIGERVESGASLWVFAGDRIDRDWYEQKFGASAEKCLLGYRYGEIKQAATDATTNATGDGNTANSAAPTTPRIAAGPYHDAALSLFNNPQQGRLDQIAVKSWMTLERPNDAKDGSAGESLLLKLNNDAPLLVRRTVGKGSVFQWSTRANDTWSEIPTRPAYVPLVQRLLLFTHGSFEPHRTGELRIESKNDPLTGEELQRLAESLGGVVHDSTNSFLQRDSDQRYGREIWRWILVALLVVLFGELFVEKRITRGGA
jgi:hypothetical protein